VFDKASFDLHRRIVTELENGVSNRNWLLWLKIEEEDHETKVAGLAPEIDTWLDGCDPDGGVTVELDGPWTEGQLVMRLRALPKPRDARGGSELFGNPYPPFAEWTGN
jgi:hypothetical protein